MTTTTLWYYIYSLYLHLALFVFSLFPQIRRIILPYEFGAIQKNLFNLNFDPGSSIEDQHRSERSMELICLFLCRHLLIFRFLT